MKITHVSAPADEDFEALKNGLDGFNEVYTGSMLNEKVSAFVKDENDQTVGGILGVINWGWLYVQGLWVSDALRSQGVGADLLRTLEEYAYAKGITRYRLETTTFQALGFYKKQGYEVFAEVADMPPGFTSYFLKKQIEA